MAIRLIYRPSEGTRSLQKIWENKEIRDWARETTELNALVDYPASLNSKREENLDCTKFTTMRLHDL